MPATIADLHNNLHKTPPPHNEGGALSFRKAQSWDVCCRNVTKYCADYAYFGQVMCRLCADFRAAKSSLSHCFYYIFYICCADCADCCQKVEKVWKIRVKKIIYVNNREKSANLHNLHNRAELGFFRKPVLSGRGAR